MKPQKHLEVLLSTNKLAIKLKPNAKYQMLVSNVVDWKQKMKKITGLKNAVELKIFGILKVADKQIFYVLHNAWNHF